MFEPGQPYRRDEALLEELGHKTGQQADPFCWSAADTKKCVFFPTHIAGPSMKMYFLIENGDIPACYVSVTEGNNNQLINPNIPNCEGMNCSPPKTRSGYVLDSCGSFPAFCGKVERQTNMSRLTLQQQRHMGALWLHSIGN